jgi:hypothetical protein
MVKYTRRVAPARGNITSLLGSCNAARLALNMNIAASGGFQELDFITVSHYIPLISVEVVQMLCSVMNLNYVFKKYGEDLFLSRRRIDASSLHFHAVLQTVSAETDEKT